VFLVAAEANRRSKTAVADDAERAAARWPPKRRPERPDAKGDAGQGRGLGVGREGEGEDDGAASAAGLEIAAAAAAETRVEEPVVERESRALVRGGMAAKPKGRRTVRGEGGWQGGGGGFYIGGREFWETRGGNARRGTRASDR
jgi:hypothetical protein